jgi:uncharacterized protein (DUF2236 family)
MAVVARLFGTPGDVLPVTLADLREYFSTQIEGPAIAVTKPAREVARVVLESPLRGPLRVVTPAHRLATAEQLPPRLRQEYGLRMTRLHRPLLSLAGSSLRFGGRSLLLVAGHVRPPVPLGKESAAR